MNAALGFVALCELLGLAALPLVSVVLGRLPSGAGLAFAKPLGLLLVAWLTWLGASAGFDLSAAGVLACALVLAAAGVALARTASAGSRPAPRLDRRQALAAIRSPAWWVPEAVFLVAFAAMALVVSHAPDVWGTEKPMDMAIINAITVGDGAPPRDPWFAGSPLDGYYYLGHWAAALPLVVTGVEPTVGYNLALCAFFAVTAAAAYGLGSALGAAAHGRPLLAGLALAGLLTVAGNVASAVTLAGHDGPLAAYPWFDASRVVPDTINEFPAFSWLLGDVHAHVIAVPFTLVALAFARQWLGGGARAAEVVVAGIACGVLYAVNSWSYPVTTGLLVLALAASTGSVGRRLSHAGLLVAAGLVAVAPFLASFDAPASGLALVTERRSLPESLRDAALTVGLPLWLVAAAYLAAARGRSRTSLVVAALVTATAVAVGALVGGRLGWAALLAVLAGVAAWRLLRAATAAHERFGWLTAFGGLTCLLLPELVFVRDAFAGSALERMNTVFKLGYQAWILLAIAGVGALATAGPRLLRPVRLVWSAGALVLAAAALAFPLAGSQARTGGFAGPARLDGREWLRAGAPGDVAAIDWLRRHAAADSVVLETAGDDYSPAGHARISTFTGRSTVIGWPGHVLQWGEDPGLRRDDVARLYRETDPAAIAPALAAYGIDYVIVGPLERTDHGSAGEAKWDRLARRVFEQAGTTVWRLGR